MAATVRCAGGGNAPWNLNRGRGVAEPCGWKGERFTEPPARRLKKPCPWCKGRVEHIPERGGG